MSERLVRGLPYNEYRRLWRAGFFATTSRANPKRRCPGCGAPSGRPKSKRGYACRACKNRLDRAGRARRSQLVRGGAGA